LDNPSVIVFSLPSKPWAKLALELEHFFYFLTTGQIRAKLHTVFYF
jgi:hypothetical protein